MFGLFAKTFRAHPRTEARGPWDAPAHWRQAERFDNRRDAEIEAHQVGRRRD